MSTPAVDFGDLRFGEADWIGVLLLHLDQDACGVVLAGQDPRRSKTSLGILFVIGRL
jgi:hypothetical protein